MPNFISRRDTLRAALVEAEVDAMLVSLPANVTYLTGFTGGDSYLLVSPRGELLLTDTRYASQISRQCPGLELLVRRAGTQMLELIEKAVGQLGPRRLAIEADHLTASARDKAQEKLDVELASTSGLVEKLREIKDAEEIAAIRRAVRLAERVFEVIRRGLRPEMSERRVAADLEYQARLLGAKAAAFPTIVGVDQNAALPHGQPSDRLLEGGELLLIDWGVIEQLYISDLTRVLALGRITPKLREVYEVVLGAQKRAIAAIRPGALRKEVDAAARDHITQAGFGEYFGHGLGHGIGLQVHESVRMAPDQEEPLAAGMVITVEPGVYLPEWGGVRIEDDILVTDAGHEVLSGVPKELDECVVWS